MAKMATLAATEAAAAAVVAAEAAAATAAAATAAVEIAGTTVLPTRDKLGRPPPTKTQPDGPQPRTVPEPPRKPGPKYSVYVDLVLIPNSTTQEREVDETPLQELLNPDCPLTEIRNKIQTRFRHLDITEIKLLNANGTRIPWLDSSTPVTLEFNHRHTDLRAEIRYQQE